MPILEALAKDHRTIEEHLQELAAIPSTEGDRRIERFGQLQALLQAHARAEEEVVYRRLRQRIPDEPKLAEAYEEHHVADILLQELASGCPGGPGWVAKARVLEELVRHHVKEEELTLFKLIDEQFAESEQLRLGDEFHLLKHERLEQILGPIRRATPAIVGRATVTAQAAAGRLVRRGEAQLRRAVSRFKQRREQARDEGAMEVRDDAVVEAREAAEETVE